MDVVKNTQLKGAKLVPQRSKHAGYVMPHASVRLEVREPSGLTRKTEVEELERARARALAAHSTVLKLEVVAFAVVRRERKSNRKV